MQGAWGRVILPILNFGPKQTRISCRLSEIVAKHGSQTKTEFAVGPDGVSGAGAGRLTRPSYTPTTTCDQTLVFVSERTIKDIIIMTMNRQLLRNDFSSTCIIKKKGMLTCIFLYVDMYILS